MPDCAVPRTRQRECPADFSKMISNGEKTLSLEQHRDPI